MANLLKQLYTILIVLIIAWIIYTIIQNRKKRKEKKVRWFDDSNPSGMQVNTKYFVKTPYLPENIMIEQSNLKPVKNLNSQIFAEPAVIEPVNSDKIGLMYNAQTYMYPWWRNAGAGLAFYPSLGEGSTDMKYDNRPGEVMFYSAT